MCGFAGILNFKPSPDPEAQFAALRKMVALQTRRGPDDEAFWKEEKALLGFRRLAVLDPSEAGRQPIASHDGRSVLVFNGEIYNFRELKAQLQQKGVPFRSGSDSEVLVEALNFWGISVVQRLNGIFAFAWYRPQIRKLVLARDHAGIKPLYYLLPPGKEGIAFASQFNSLLHTTWRGWERVSQEALHLYLSLHYFPAPYTLFENTFQLEAGTLLEIDESEGIQKTVWWSMPETIHPDLEYSEGLEAVRSSLDAAIRRQRIADVPLGSFLSGGIDSPLVSALARKQHGAGFKSFTIGNPGWGQDESVLAKSYGKALDLDFHLQNMDDEKAFEIMTDVFSAQHEPFADFSIIPSCWLSRFAGSEVTVALSGDGGDELFFGYERPFSLMKNGRDFRWPRVVRAGLYGWGKYGPGPKRSTVIVSKSPGHYYFDVNKHWESGRLKQLAPELKAFPQDFKLYNYPDYRNEEDLAHFSRLAEYRGQLQRCLKKVDTASMHYGLEVRVPLLDREVIETSLRIRPSDHMAGNERKRILKDILSDYIPRDQFQQKKLGFAVPLGQWLRGPLRNLAEEALLGTDSYPEGVFRKAEIKNYWNEHLSGSKDHKWGLWTLIALQMWKRTHLQ